MDKRKKQFSVHVWLPELTRTKGGIQAFSQELVHALRHNVGDFSFSIFVKNDITDPKNERDAGFSCWRSFGNWPRGPLRTAWFSISIVYAALRDRPRLIIAGHANFAPVAALIRRMLRVASWAIVYGIEVWDKKGHALSGSLREMDRLISISRFTRDKVMAEQNFERERFVLLPCTFNADRFHPGPKSEQLLRRYGIPSDRKIILTVCRLIHEERSKGYEQILAALPKILSSVPNGHFVLAGKGDDEPRIRQLVEKGKLEGHVTLAGFVPDEHLVDLYNSCDVFALPSCHEGFGIVFIEALACGKPVLGGSRDGAVDALCNGELGVLIDPDSIDDLAVNLTRLLKGEHSHPLVYRPAELRARVIEEFGRERFAERVAGLLYEFKQTQMR